MVKAPFDGIILNRTVEVGQTIISAMQPVPMFIIAEAGYMIARIKITDKELSALSLGQKVSVKVSGKNTKARSAASAWSQWAQEMKGLYTRQI